MLHALELDLVERGSHCNLLQPTAGTVAMADTAGMVGMATPGRVTHTHLGKQIGRARARWRPLRHAPFHHHERSGSVSSAGVTCGHTCCGIVVLFVLELKSNTSQLNSTVDVLVVGALSQSTGVGAYSCRALDTWHYYVRLF